MRRNENFVFVECVMPELPEVETMCRGVSPVIGATIERVVDPKCTYRPIVCVPPLRSIQRSLRGQTITGVSRIGKRVIIETNRWALVLQPKMTGLVSIDAPPDPEHVRLILQLSEAAAERLTFWDRRGLGTIALLAREEVEARLVTGKLGPDALMISAEEFASRLSASRRPIKVALLDQKLVAGIGNLYASEMLHAAGIDPLRSAAEIETAAYKRLSKHMRRILTDAIKHEGSTLSDGTYRNALNQAGSYQNHHRVYDREGQPCPEWHGRRLKLLWHNDFGLGCEGMSSTCSPSPDVSLLFFLAYQDAFQQRFQRSPSADCPIAARVQLIQAGVMLRTLLAPAWRRRSSAGRDTS